MNSVLSMIGLAAMLFSASAFSQGVSSAKPWMGVAIEDHKDGVKVVQTIEGTPAEKAGLKSGDVITKIDSVKMKSSSQLIKTVQNSGVGNTIKVEFLRAAKAMSVNLKLVPRPDALKFLQDKFTGKKAPVGPVEDVFSGKKFNFPASTGKVTVVEFWATWCPACLASFQKITPKVADLQKAGVEFVAISDEPADLVKKHFGKKQAFPVYVDQENQTFKSYFVSALPTLFVIDKNGVIQYVAIGAGEYLDTALKKAVELSIDTKKK